MQVRDKRILVVGMGRSGMAAARLLSRAGARVTVNDRDPSGTHPDAEAALSGLGVELIQGAHPEAAFVSAEGIVISPGVPVTLPPLQAARKAGIPVIGELELAAGFTTAVIVAVTGTNGKSTVTELTGAMLAASGKRVWVGGNLGTPLSAAVMASPQPDVVVVEVSSFQLDSIDTFRPHVAVLLNVTPDHLDRYDSMAAYQRSKRRVFENQKPDDVAILNMDDPWAASLSDELIATVQGYGAIPPGMEGICLAAAKLVFSGTRQDRQSIPLSAAKLFGRHNQGNMAAAALAALAAGATDTGVRTALATFSGLPHRIEYVGTAGNVAFYNDSKATNVDAVEKALNAFEMPVVLIMGGRDKNGDFSVLKDRVAQSVKTLILMGEAANGIQRQLEGVISGIRVADMDAAVQAGYAAAGTDGVVLLSPGCASFDMFQSYGHRGDVFRESVQTLIRQVRS